MQTAAGGKAIRNNRTTPETFKPLPRLLPNRFSERLFHCATLVGASQCGLSAKKLHATRRRTTRPAASSLGGIPHLKAHTGPSPLPAHKHSPPDTGISGMGQGSKARTAAGQLDRRACVSDQASPAVEMHANTGESANGIAPETGEQTAGQGKATSAPSQRAAPKRSLRPQVYLGRGAPITRSSHPHSVATRCTQPPIHRLGGKVQNRFLEKSR